MSGRAETTNVIPGLFALSVGPAQMPAPPGWVWVRLQDVARLETGHTPSREHPEYWNGDVGWIGIKDAREHHGGYIHSTSQTVTPLGLENSAARLLPANTVCLSRTASVGYVVIMGKPMATSQDFVNWVCSEAIEPTFLMHLLIAENESLFRFGKGTTHTTIYFPEVKAFHVCLPPVAEQRRIVSRVEGLKARSRKALTELEPVPRFLEEYRQSVLAAAFRGDLTGEWREGHPDAEPATNELRASPDWQSAKTKLRGAAETVNIIAGRYALSVGPAELDVPGAWPQVRLTDIARLESGHTPSRECPEYWDGDIGWIGIRDAREHHGREIHQTFQRVTQAGLDNSAARLLPAKTVCLSRTASVGYVVVMGKPMATSQDFVNWVCSPAIEPSFLMYLLMAENESLFRFGKGTTHTTIYFPEVKAFHIYLPPVAEQREIVKQIEARLPWMERLMANVHAALTDFDCLDRAILAQAFRGELVEQDPADEPASVLLERIRAERNGTGRPVTAVTAHQAAKLLVVRYLVMLLRTWNAKAARETLETCLVLMLNDDARRAILGKKPAAKAKTKKAATGRTHMPGLDHLLGELVAARFLTPPETVRGKQVFGLGANAPSAADLKSHVRAEDEGRLKETLDALEALGEERSRLELDAVSHATYELVS